MVAEVCTGTDRLLNCKSLVSWIACAHGCHVGDNCLC